METKVFRVGDFGRPRSGTIALSCASERGCASRSAFAAARIARSSAAVGIRIVGFLDLADIVFHLASCRQSRTDDSSSTASVDERNVVERVGPRRQRNHAIRGLVPARSEPRCEKLELELERSNGTSSCLRLNQAWALLPRCSADSYSALLGSASVSADSVPYLGRHRAATAQEHRNHGHSVAGSGQRPRRDVASAMVRG